MLIYLSVILLIWPLSSNQESRPYTYQYIATHNGAWIPPLKVIFDPPEPAITCQKEAAKNKQNAYWALRPEWMIVWVTLLYTIISALALIAIYWQVRISRESSKRQLRAYIVVNIGDAMWQERDKGFNFGAFPLMTNVGQTPAYNLRFIAKAGVFPTLLPPSFVLSETYDETGETILGMNAPMKMHAKYPDFIHDDDVEAVKSGNRENSLYTWGIIHYTDCFGDRHYTRFCHRIKWLPDNGPVYGYYIPGRNNAD